MRHNIGSKLIFIGILCILASFIGVLHNKLEDNQAEQESHNIICEIQKVYADESSVSEVLTYEGIPEIDKLAYSNTEKTVDIDGISYVGMISIPRLNLELPIIKEISYSSLKKAPCVYSGSYKDNNLVIGAHNYRSHFGNLKYLTAGDVVIYTDMLGDQITYIVDSTEILNKDQVEQLIESEFDLSLFTCTIGGSQRVVVRCNRG